MFSQNVGDIAENFRLEYKNKISADKVLKAYRPSAKVFSSSYRYLYKPYHFLKFKFSFFYLSINLSENLSVYQSINQSIYHPSISIYIYTERERERERSRSRKIERYRYPKKID